jgi:hypothetical protein
MGSYPRREKAEQKARECADTVPALDCQSCGAFTPGERFRYFADQMACEVSRRKVDHRADNKREIRHPSQFSCAVWFSRGWRQAADSYIAL